MLVVKNVHKSYRGIPALIGVNFSVEAGEVVGYVGPNGSGKSTTVKIVTGLMAPDSGEVTFNGLNIRTHSAEYHRSIGYVPEEAQVYTHLSGLEYLQLVGRLREISEKMLNSKANEILNLFGLGPVRHSPISLYSKGMKQRVLISAALLHNPEFLIFDEPLSGLDVVSARLFTDLLISLARSGKGVLYISHAIDVVERVCSRVIVLGAGRVLADSSPASLRKDLGHESLGGVFAHLVQENDTSQTADELVKVMAVESE